MPLNTQRKDSKIAMTSINAALQRKTSLNKFGANIWRTLCNFPMRWFVSLALLVFATTTFAQTPVSGSIAVNTHWSSANSPYLLSGDMVVQNGAELTIDPGVTIYMAANASLTVQGGSIKAIGTTVDPISVLSDKARLAQNALPGDWRQWVFSAGTVNTRLDHVLFEHGSGLAIKGSSPVLNYLKINNHQGAAIAIDLAASPTGVGKSGHRQHHKWYNRSGGRHQWKRRMGITRHSLCGWLWSGFCWGFT